MPTDTTNPATDTIATQLAAFAHGLKPDMLPAAVVEQAKLLMLDALGIALASSRHDFAHCAYRGLHALGGAGDSAVMGAFAPLPLRDAVLMNGILVHGLDFDDTHPGAITHPSASAFPLALGLAAQRHATGAEMITAYVLAIEVAARLGAAARGGFHDVGFHPTGLVGAFGCALAAGKLMGLDQAGLAHAQGVVLSMASGSMEFLSDGAWTKRMHPGWAGVSGLTATALAGAGFRGPSQPYEGRFGLYASHLAARGLNADLSLCTRGLGERWELLEVAVKLSDYIQKTLKIASDVSFTKDAYNDWSTNKPIIIDNVVTPSGISSYGIVGENIKGEITATPTLNITNINSTTGSSNFILNQEGVILREPTIYTIDSGVGISRDVVTAGGGVISFRNGVFISGSGLAEGSSLTVIEDLTGQSGSYIFVSGSYITNSSRIYVNGITQIKDIHYSESPPSGATMIDEIQFGDGVLFEYVPLIT